MNLILEPDVFEGNGAGEQRENLDIRLAEKRWKSLNKKMGKCDRKL